MILVHIDILMEVTKAREFISPEPHIPRSGGSTNSSKNDKNTEISERGSGVFKDSSHKENVEGGKELERVSSVEYTRNNNYEDANGRGVQPDIQQSRFALWRAQADQDMIRCIKEDDTHQTYFIYPPVNPITLFFRDKLTEKDYRKNYRFQSREERRTSSAQIIVGNVTPGSPERHPRARSTWSPSGFTAIFDLVVSMFTFLIICLGKKYGTDIVSCGDQHFWDTLLQGSTIHYIHFCFSCFPPLSNQPIVNCHLLGGWYLSLCLFLCVLQTNGCLLA